ncbi:hypothetical protein C8R47DRAFT_314825 [Mycena vitilis]|nr:hypothetical protein C8R47DRAFT_314825 [Mycena vitilis]
MAGRRRDRRGKGSSSNAPPGPSSARSPPPATGQRRRRADSAENDDPPQRPTKKSRAKAKAPDSPEVAQAKRRKGRRDPDHIRRENLQDDEKGLQASMNLLVQCLWGILSGTDIAENASASDIDIFGRRFATADAWDSFRATLTYNPAEALAHIVALRRNVTLRRKNPIANNIIAMEDHNLHLMFAAVLSSGLQKFRPDVIGGTRDTLYNRAHETVAIKAFQDVAANHGFVRLSPDLTKLNDITLLQRLYRNYVWSNMRKRILAEARSPGSVTLRSKLTQDSKRRTSLADKRTVAIIGEAWTETVGALTAESFCNSDDERDPADGSYIIVPKTARSHNATNFIRSIDKYRKEVGLADGRWEERERKVVAGTQPSRMSMRLPRNVPIDWFKPEVFNKYPVALRARYRDSGVALPLARHWENGRVPDKFKTMTNTEFEPFSTEVLALYNLPTDEEIAQMEYDDEEYNEYGEPDEMDVDDEDDGNGDEEGGG